MAFNTDNQLKILEDQLEDLVKQQNLTHNKIDTAGQEVQKESEKIRGQFEKKRHDFQHKLEELTREEAREVEKIQNRSTQLQAQLRREYDGYIRQAETVRQQIDRHKRKQADDEAAKAKSVRSTIPLKR